jgi:hypothetical protein
LYQISSRFVIHVIVQATHRDLANVPLGLLLYAPILWLLVYAKELHEVISFFRQVHPVYPDALDRSFSRYCLIVASGAMLISPVRCLCAIHDILLDISCVVCRNVEALGI